MILNPFKYLKIRSSEKTIGDRISDLYGVFFGRDICLYDEYSSIQMYSGKLPNPLEPNPPGENVLYLLKIGENDIKVCTFADAKEPKTLTSEQRQKLNAVLNTVENPPEFPAHEKSEPYIITRDKNKKLIGDITKICNYKYYNEYKAGILDYLTLFIPFGLQLIQNKLRELNNSKSPLVRLLIQVPWLIIQPLTSIFSWGKRLSSLILTLPSLPIMAIVHSKYSQNKEEPAPEAKNSYPNMMILGLPSTWVFETKAHPHARFFRTTLTQKIIDAFDFFNGKMIKIPNSPQCVYHLGLLDMNPISLPLIFWQSQMSAPINSAFLRGLAFLLDTLFFAPLIASIVYIKHTLAFALTLISIPVITVLHGISLGAGGDEWKKEAAAALAAGEEEDGNAEHWENLEEVTVRVSRKKDILEQVTVTFFNAGKKHSSTVENVPASLVKLNIGGIATPTI